MTTKPHTRKLVSSEAGGNHNVIAATTLAMAFVGYLAYQVDYLFNISMLRILYSVMLYGTMALIGYVFITNENRRKLNEDPKYGIYFFILLLFVLYNVVRDYDNPKFSAITLYNNSYALASVVPIFGLIIGINTTDPTKLKKMLQAGAILFCIYAVYTLFRKEFAPKVFTALVIPFAVFALTEKKYIQAILMFGVAAIHSTVVDYRVLILSMLVFSGLFASLNITRKSGILKFTVVIVAAVAMYFIITDLDAVLSIFQSTKSFGKTATDTRSFLYQEIFDDLHPDERLTGRGFLGTYFSPYFYKIRDTGIPEYYIRFSVEVAFLELLLKGGYIYVTLYFLPVIYIAIKAISQKKDELILVFNIGIYLLTEFFICFFENIPEYSIHNFIIFLFAGYAYNQIRTSNQKIKIPKIKPRRVFEV